MTPPLEHRTRFWPMMLFPNTDRSHSIALIGWRDGRPVWFKDVVCGSPGRLILTAEYLHGRGNIFSMWSWIDVPRRAIESARPSPRAEGVLEVRFRESRKSRFLGFLTRRELGGTILLNLGDACEEWLAELGGSADGSTGRQAIPQPGAGRASRRHRPAPHLASGGDSETPNARTAGPRGQTGCAVQVVRPVPLQTPPVVWTLSSPEAEVGESKAPSKRMVAVSAGMSKAKAPPTMGTLAGSRLTPTSWPRQPTWPPC